MTLPAPDALTRVFAQAFSSRDTAALAALFAEDADFLSLTGIWAEGREAIERLLASELAGAFIRTKLVTGRVKSRRVGPNAVQVMQRFVLSGIQNADGSDAGRVGAILTALLVRGFEGWEIAGAQFTAEG